MGKVYCKVYQGAFKIGMNLMPWKMPETLEGAGKIKELPKFIKDKGINKVLVVTDKVLNQDLHMLDSLYDAMKSAGLDHVTYDKVKPNPTDTSIEEGVKLFNDNKCEAIIAFGGGSPMDCAKGIGARAVKKNKSVRQLHGLFKVLHKIPTIFAVPTTAGTGSETTIAAVITLEKDHHKITINDLSLMPKYAVLDPELTVGLPPHVTSTTGMDALCHAVESYTNKTYNSKLEDDLAKKAVKLIDENLYTCYSDGKNLEARQNMQLAAFYAGRAFTRGCVGYVHAVGHTLSGLYGMPHGLTMSIILPHVMRQFGSAVHKRLAELADVIGIEGKSDAEKSDNFIKWIDDLNQKMEIPTTIDKIEDKDIDQIIEWASKEANPLYPVPVIWGKEDFKKLLNTIRGK